MILIEGIIIYIINVIAFLCGFIKSFHYKKDETETLCGKIIYSDGVPVTGIVKGEK